MNEQPYPGLRPFMQDETNIFFGREDQIDELLVKLEDSHFLAVVGPSGCGKSSLVRTGLLDALKSGFMMSAGTRWQIADFKPGDGPMWNLSSALHTALKTEEKIINHDIRKEIREVANYHANLSQGLDGLMKLMSRVQLPPDTNLLLLADQFEEIFRFRDIVSEGVSKEDSKYESEKFVMLLLEAARQKKYPIFVIMTMRTGFLERCFEFDSLPMAINSSQFLTPMLNEEQLIRAIVGPAKVFGGNVRSDLVDRLISDMSPNPDDLPLLQHALMRIWNSAQERDQKKPVLMTIDDYDSTGGLRDALSNHADEALEELEEKYPDDVFLAEILFRELTERTKGSVFQDIRRPRRVWEVAEVAALRNDQWKRIGNVIKVFQDSSRCFITTRTKLETKKESLENITKDTILDISHESLIRRWETLKKWVSKETQKAEEYEGLVREMQNYKEAMGGLLDDLKVQHYNEWWQKNNPTAQWAKRYSGPNNFDEVKFFFEKSKKEIKKKKEEKDKIRKLKLEQAQHEKDIAKQRAEIAEREKELEKARAEKAEKEKEKEIERERAKATRNKLIFVIILILVLASTLFAIPKFMTYKHNKFIDSGNNSIKGKNYKKAVEYYNKAIYWNSDNPNAYLSLGNAFNFLAKYNEAIVNFGKGIKIAPKYPDLYKSLGYTYFKKNDYSKAIRNFKTAINLAPEKVNYNIYNYNIAGYELINPKKPNAIEYYKKAIEIDPQNIEAYLIVGQIFLEQGEEDDAIKYYKKAIEMAHDKVDSNVYATVGNALLKQSREGEAIDYYKEAIKIEPDNLYVNISLGDAYYKLKMENNAIEYYKKAIEMALDMVNIETYNNVSEILYKQGKKDEADKYNKIANEIENNKKIRTAEYEKRVSEVDFDNYTDYITKGKTLLNQGKEDEATGYFKKAIDLAPDKIDANVYTSVGYTLLKQGKEDEATGYFKKAIDLAPDKIDVNACRIVGNALLKHDKKEAEAIIYYKKVLNFVNNYPGQNKGFDIDAFQADIEARLRNQKKKNTKDIRVFLGKVGFDS